MMDMEKIIKEILERLDKLEKDSHPPIGICEFDGWKELVERVKKLEDGV